MSDQSKNGGANGAASAEGEATTLPLHVLVQYVKDLSFENPNAPQSLVHSQPAPQVNVRVNIDASAVGEGVYEVVLGLRCEAKQEEAIAFLVEVAYAGLFQLPGVPPEHHRPILMIEGGRLLFPFARAIIADATREGGYPPLLLNPVDFAELFRQRIANEGQAQA
jgi:preprotein translocase subunit SecB